MANASAAEAHLEDPGFIEANLKHSINGCAAAAAGQRPRVSAWVTCSLQLHPAHTLTLTCATRVMRHPPRSYLYCNVPGLEFAQARPSRVYFMALGGSGDMHTPNSAESGFYMDGQRRQALRLLPGSMLTSDIS